MLSPAARCAEVNAPPTVAIFLDFDAAPADASLEVMKREAAHLLQPSGVELNWRSLRDQSGAAPLDGLLVMKFRGKCSLERWSQPSDYGIPPRGPAALARTRVQQGRVLPFSEVKCELLRRSLAYLKPEAGRKEQQQALGLAMGRVVAHELYHVLARTTGHAAQGLARATQSFKDLVTGTVSFEEGDARAIASGLRPAR